MTSPATSAPPDARSLRARYRDAVSTLKHRQKTSKGAPAYSRFVNRPLGRRFAALAHLAGLTPNAVTAISAVATFTGIGLIALVRPTWWSSVLVAALLVVGYALDAADGQLARLRGGGSPEGEWLDHVVDAFKTSLLHIAVLVCAWRFFDGSELRLLAPAVFAVLAPAMFFTVILTDLLRRAHRGGTQMRLAGEGSSSTLYSLAVVPTDYGLMCLLFVLLFWQPGFMVVYGLVLVANLAFAALALPKWFREVRGFGRADAEQPAAEHAPEVTDVLPATLIETRANA
jgi:phosphatidylglycerophosphate synthase